MQVVDFIVLSTSFLCVSAHQNDIVYIIDISDSLSQADLNQSVDFLYDTTNWLTIGPTDIKIAIVTFSDVSNVIYDFNSFSDKNSVLYAISSLKSITTTGGTFTNLALDDAFHLLINSSLGARANSNKTVVVLTDGKATNLLAAEASANNLQNAGVEVFSVGLGSDFSSDQAGLQKISSDPDSYYIYYADSFIYLCNIIPHIVPKLESGILATISPNCLTTTTTTQNSKLNPADITTASTDTSSSTAVTSTSSSLGSTIITQTSQSTDTTKKTQSTTKTQTAQSSDTTQSTQSNTSILNSHPSLFQNSKPSGNSGKSNGIFAIAVALVGIIVTTATVVFISCARKRRKVHQNLGSCMLVLWALEVYGERRLGSSKESFQSLKLQN